MPLIEHDDESPWAISDKTLIKIESSYMRDENALKGLMKKFVAALANDFNYYGDAVIARIREESPIAYARLIVQLFPKQAEITNNTVSSTYVHLSTDRLNEKLIELAKDDSIKHD